MRIGMVRSDGPNHTKEGEQRVKYMNVRFVHVHRERPLKYGVSVTLTETY